jgi:hypothetical protein
MVTIQRSRSIESTPWRRFQHVLFCLGLFHAKMAAADALLRVLLRGHSDDNSLIKLIGILRPKETGTFTSQSGPGFRRMHDVVRQIGTVSRLDIWRVELQKRGFESLDAFLASSPSWELIVEISEHLHATYLAGKGFESTRTVKPKKERDPVRENAELRNKYFCLYEELYWAMNEGDIGRVEDVLMPWVLIFRACGKHKYAAHLTRLLYNLHFVFPGGLR